MNSPKVQSFYVYKQIEAYLFQGTTMRNSLFGFEIQAH
jgi:hypothetical protein